MLEGAVLALLLERYPAWLTCGELLREMCGAGEDRERRLAVGRAVEELTAVGLLRRDGEFVLPTEVALRVAELRLEI